MPTYRIEADGKTYRIQADSYEDALEALDMPEETSAAAPAPEPAKPWWKTVAGLFSGPPVESTEGVEKEVPKIAAGAIGRPVAGLIQKALVGPELLSGGKMPLASQFTDFYNRAEEKVTGVPAQQPDSMRTLGEFMAPTPLGKSKGVTTIAGAGKSGLKTGAMSSLMTYNPEGPEMPGATAQDTAVGASMSGVAASTLAFLPGLRNVFSRAAQKAMDNPTAEAMGNMKAMHERAGFAGMEEYFTLGQRTGDPTILALENNISGRAAQEFYNKQRQEFARRIEKMLPGKEGVPSEMGVAAKAVFKQADTSIQGRASADYGRGLAEASNLARAETEVLKPQLSNLRATLNRIVAERGPGWLNEFPPAAVADARKIDSVVRAADGAEELARAQAAYRAAQDKLGKAMWAADRNKVMDEIQAAGLEYNNLLSARLAAGLPADGLSVQNLVDLHRSAKTLQAAVYNGSTNAVDMANYRAGRELLNAVDADLNEISRDSPAWAKFKQTRANYRAAMLEREMLQASALGRAFGKDFHPDDPRAMFESLLRQTPGEQAKTVDLLKTMAPELMGDIKSWKLADTQRRMVDMAEKGNVSAVDPATFIRELTDGNDVVGRLFWSDDELQRIRAGIGAARTILTSGQGAVRARPVEVERVGMAVQSRNPTFVTGQMWKLLGRGKMEKMLFTKEGISDLLTLANTTSASKQAVARAVERLTLLAEEPDEGY